MDGNNFLQLSDSQKDAVLSFSMGISYPVTGMDVRVSATGLKSMFFDVQCTDSKKQKKMIRIQEGKWNNIDASIKEFWPSRSYKVILRIPRTGKLSTPDLRIKFLQPE